MKSIDRHAAAAQQRSNVGLSRSCALAAIISDGPAPTRPELEDQALTVFRCHGLPKPSTNSKVQGIEVDFLFPEARLIERDH